MAQNSETTALGQGEGLANSGFCAPSPSGRSCGCSISLDSPPKRPDPWIYDVTSGQVAQFAAFQASPGSAAPPAFWIPNRGWEYPPGTTMPFAFFLPNCGVNLYSTYPPNAPPPALSPTVQVTVGNNGGVTAVNTLVRLSMSYLGIGRKRVPVGSQLVTIPANGQVTLDIPIPASFLAADPLTRLQNWLGVNVDVEHPHDQNLANDHTVSMWLAPGGEFATVGGAGVDLSVPVFNEFSSGTEVVTFAVIPAQGAVVTGVPAPVSLSPGQWQWVAVSLTVPAAFSNPGAFLAPLATIVGVDSRGNFIDGLTFVGYANN